MDTPGMEKSPVWVKPPRIPVTILSRAASSPAPADTQSTGLAMRVWVALPKKAALYTMKYLPEQCFERTPCDM